MNIFDQILAELNSKRFVAHIKKINGRIRVGIKCVCGTKFLHQKHNKTVDKLSRCPQCNELWHFEKDKDGEYVIIRPKTSETLIFTESQVKRNSR